MRRDLALGGQARPGRGQPCRKRTCELGPDSCDARARPKREHEIIDLAGVAADTLGGGERNVDDCEALAGVDDALR